MGRKALNLVGMVQGKLKVISRNYSQGTKNSKWNCICSCGKEIIVSGMNLNSGNTKSCGCTTSFLGGKSKTKEHKVWQQMLQRCNNENHNKYYRYGGKGIKVCKEWETNFLQFLEDMGTRPSDSHSLDRIDNSKGYYPGNCAWRNVTEQNNNRGDYNVMITYDGETKTASQWAKLYKLNASTVIARIKRYGWSPERALNTPIMK